MDTISKEQRSRLMSKITSKNTVPEIIVRKLLHKLGYRFRLHYKSLPGKPDIVLVSRRKVIFVNGCFWHGHGCHISSQPKSNVDYWKDKIARNKARDTNTLKALQDLGWDILIVWECETKANHSLEEVLTEFLKKE